MVKSGSDSTSTKVVPVAIPRENSFRSGITGRDE